MKVLTVSLVVTALLVAGGLFAADGPAHEQKGPLYHVVSIKFKDNASNDQIHEVEQAFVALKSRIPGIHTLHWGTNVSPEQRNHGYTHCFVLTFGSDKDRDAYLVHPAHKEFGKVLGPVLADVFVIDFWSRE